MADNAHERDVVKPCVALFEQFGILCIRQPQWPHKRRRAPAPGVSDYLLCFEGRFVACEFKSATGKQSDDQEVFQSWVEKAGGVYVLIRDVEEAMDFINEMRR